MLWSRDKFRIPQPEDAPPGRSEALPIPEFHFVNGHPLAPPFPAGMRMALFGMGCFWGAERCFWELPGVYSTAVGYAGGTTPNPTYQEVCTGMTGHAEVVRVVFDPRSISYAALLRRFWESHDPTQGMRQATTSAPNTAPRFIPTAKISAPPHAPRATPIRRRCTPRGAPPSAPRSAPRRSFTLPRIITSSTSRKIPVVIAGCAAPGSIARLHRWTDPEPAAAYSSPLHSSEWMSGTPVVSPFSRWVTGAD